MPVCCDSYSSYSTWGKEGCYSYYVHLGRCIYSLANNWISLNKKKSYYSFKCFNAIRNNLTFPQFPNEWLLWSSAAISLSAVLFQLHILKFTVITHYEISFIQFFFPPSTYWKRNQGRVQIGLKFRQSCESALRHSLNVCFSGHRLPWLFEAFYFHVFLCWF